MALLLSFLAVRGASDVPIGAFLVVLQQWLLVASVCRTFLVGRGVRRSSTWSVLLSVVSGQGILCGPLERWGAGRLFRRGIRLRAVVGSSAHGSCSEAWVQMQLSGSLLFWCFQNKSAHPCKPPLWAFTSTRGFASGRHLRRLACIRSLERRIAQSTGSLAPS